MNIFFFCVLGFLGACFFVCGVIALFDMQKEKKYKEQCSKYFDNFLNDKKW